MVVAVLTLPGVAARENAEPCCESAVAFLRTASPNTSDEAVAAASVFGLRVAKELQLAEPGKPTLNDLERIVALGVDLGPAVRDFVARSEAARPLQGEIEQIANQVERTMRGFRQPQPSRPGQ